MSHEIVNIESVKPEDSRFYFIDTNIWLMALRNTSSLGTLNRFEKTYVDFFEGIISLNLLDPKHQKKAKNIPKIVVTNLLLAEMVNAYLQHVAMKLYFGNNYRSKNFKKDYRENNSSDYPEMLEKLKSDFISFEPYIQFYSDYLNGFEILKKLDRKTDYNDTCFAMLCRKYNISVITNDQDFAYEGLTILTSNPALLRKSGGEAFP